MNGIPMRFDYTKTINEQLSTFNYYKDRYGSYELQIVKLQQENKQLKEDYNKVVHETTAFESKVYELEKDIKNIIKILNKNCDDLEATEEEFESLEKWENE